MRPWSLSMRVPSAPLLCALLLFSACHSPSGPDSQDTSTRRVTLSMTVNSEPFVVTTIAAERIAATSTLPAAFQIVASGSPDLSFLLQAPDAVGNYAIGSAPLLSALLRRGSLASETSWEAAVNAGQGEIKVTRRTATQIDGSFSLTLSPAPGPATGTKSCVGTFTVSF
jgi:hypothetical protein